MNNVKSQQQNNFSYKTPPNKNKALSIIKMGGCSEILSKKAHIKKCSTTYLE